MLIVNSRFLTQDITGVQRFAIEISKQLKELYGENIVFVAPTNIIHVDLAKELDVKVIGNKTGHIWEQIDLPIYLKQNGSPLLLNLANTAPLFYQNKIAAVHDVTHERFPKTFSWKFRLFYKLLIPNIIKTSKHTLTVSEFSKSEINKLYGTDMKNISVIYNAVNEIFKPKRTSENEKYILAVSSLSYQKNFHSLVKAFNTLNLSDTKLFLVGGINTNLASIELLREIEENKHIVFKGRVDDNELIKLYSNAICFVYPSLYEGFGIPPLEAQACGCPVICSSAASLPEVGGSSVIYCNPYSAEDIAGKIKMILDSESLQNDLKLRGFENLKRFSWKRSAKNIIEVIERLKWY
jgi:glycosyltransferase involved in cell wall biosynthesis